MKAMMLTGLRRMEIIEIPEPVLSDDLSVKIRMEVVGVCGSDIHYYTQGRIGSQVVKYPFTLGHEGAGTVVETGPAVTRVRPGDRIAIEPAMPCWDCDQCLAGRHHTCRKLRFLGCPGQAEGCLSEYLVMPETSCFPIRPELTFDEAAISEPLAIGVYAVRKSVLSEGSRMAILGSGPIGMSVMLAARMVGAQKIYMTDKIDGRLQCVKQAGADWTGNIDHEDVNRIILQQEPLMLDTVFECCGQQEAFRQAFELLKPGGKLVVVGIPEFDHWLMPVDVGRRKEIVIQHIRRQVDCVEASLRYIAEGRIKVRSMVTHRFGFRNTPEAFETVAAYRDGVMKAMIDFRERM
jgi:L-iditol 2-dehydrogenase